MTMLESNDKTTKIIDEGQFFGFRNKPSEMRNDFVTAKADLTEVIQIDNHKFQSIFSKAQLALATEKIEFIIRFVPGLRSIHARRVLEDADSLFVKEKYTKGYQVFQKGGFDKNIYVIFKGKFRILYNTGEITKINPYAH